MTAPQLVAGVLAFVQTPAGVVQVDPGEPIPADADTDHVETLREHEAIVTKAAYDKAAREARETRESEERADVPASSDSPAPAK